MLRVVWRKNKRNIKKHLSLRTCALLYQYTCRMARSSVAFVLQCSCRIIMIMNCTNVACLQLIETSAAGFHYCQAYIVVYCWILIYISWHYGESCLTSSIRVIVRLSWSMRGASPRQLYIFLFTVMDLLSLLTRHECFTQPAGKASSLLHLCTMCTYVSVCFNRQQLPAVLQDVKWFNLSLFNSR